MKICIVFTYVLLHSARDIPSCKFTLYYISYYLLNFVYKIFVNINIITNLNLPLTGYGVLWADTMYGFHGIDGDVSIQYDDTSVTNVSRMFHYLQETAEEDNRYVPATKLNHTITRILSINLTRGGHLHNPGWFLRVYPYHLCPDTHPHLYSVRLYTWPYCVLPKYVPGSNPTQNIKENSAWVCKAKV